MTRMTRHARRAKQTMRVLLATMWLAALPAQAQVVEYIHTDALGTPIAVTDASGAVIERFEYEPYGLQVAGPVADGPGYTGHVEDALTGMTYMQQRYYDPVVERFLSVDPATAYDDPVGMFNRYRYAASNPYAFTDPDGRFPGGYDHILGGAPTRARLGPSGDSSSTQSSDGAGSGTSTDESFSTSPFSLPSLPQGVVDAAAGFGDGVSSSLTFGLYSTADARHGIGIDGGVDPLSGAYGVAKITGQVQGSLTGAGAVAKALTKLSNFQQLRWLNQNKYLRFGPGKPGPGKPKVDMMRIGPSPWNIATPNRAWWTHWRL